MSYQTTAPVDHASLRALYDTAVAEIQPTRRADLTNSFYAQIGDAIFNAGCLALSDAATDTHRMLTMSAPAGSGKTSFSYALAVALTRYAENNPGAPYGVVFLVNRRDKADTVYRELEALLPGKIIVWTSDHDKQQPKGEKVTNPAATFDKKELPNYPGAVVTHEFYLDINGHFARTVVRDGKASPRALTIVDELPNEVTSVAITLSQAQAIPWSIGGRKSRHQTPHGRFVSVDGALQLWPCQQAVSFKQRMDRSTTRSWVVSIKSRIVNCN